MLFRWLRAALAIAILATGPVVAGSMTLAQEQSQPEPPKKPASTPPHRCEHEPPVTS